MSGASIGNGLPSIMTSSTTTITSMAPSSIASCKSRFPRLQECAHFHYEVSTVDIPKNFRVLMCRENEDTAKNSNSTSASVNYGLNASNAACMSNGGSNNAGSDSSVWFQLQVTSNEKKWNIYRTNENFKYLDKYLHDCIFDRKFSCLDEPVSFSSLIANDNSSKKLDAAALKQVRTALASYLERFCEIAFINAINCGPILNWFEVIEHYFISYK